MLAMDALQRDLRGPDDFWPVRDFLASLYPTSPAGSVWDVRRWDGSIWHSDVPGLAPERAARSRLWVTAGGRIVAAALSEGDRQIHPHVVPGFDDLLGEVVGWAEDAARAAGDDRSLLHVWDDASTLHDLAVDRGYAETDHWEVIRSLKLAHAMLPSEPMPNGYTMRTTRPEHADHQTVADLLNAAFGRNFHLAADLANFTAMAPSFRRDLDLVAVAPDGTFAAYAAVCWDSCNRRGTFEPVCTHPDHRRRGLAKALMLEGMRRAQALGADVIDVGTGDADPANALYSSLPFDEVHRGRFWAKEL